MRKKPTRKRRYFKMESAMTAILRDASEKMHHGILFDPPLAGTGKLCIFGHLGLVFIWSCFVSCLLLLLYYVICAPVLTEGTVF